MRSRALGFCLLQILLGPFGVGEAAWAQFDIPQRVVASGGNRAASQNYTLRGSLGQPGIGNTTTPSFQGCLGYWCEAGGTPTGILTPIQPFPFALHQNHPNPFNPSTTIRYSLPVATHVHLAIYDVLGRRVRDILNKEQEAGLHSTRVDLGTLASGQYIYRLRAGSSIRSRTLTLIK